MSHHSMDNAGHGTMEPAQHQQQSPKTRERSASGSSTGASNKQDRDNIPLYSRIFVVCSKQQSESELNEMFSKFGTIEYLRLLRDRNSNQSKGLCYIKYSKASSAAMAVESLDGKMVDGCSSPLKVQIADVKGNQTRQYGEDPEDNPPRSRLFVVCPRDMVEDVLYDEFQKYGSLQYCKVMTDRVTNESKGYAYVKFSLASKAALALETIAETGTIAGKKVKVLVADPKCRRSSLELPEGFGKTMDDVSHHAADADSVVPGDGYYDVAPHEMYMHGYPPAAYMPPAAFMPPTMGHSRVLVQCNPNVSYPQLTMLLSQFYGFEGCSMQLDSVGLSTGNALAFFAQPQLAAFAAESLNGAEFPVGSYMRTMMLDFPYVPYGHPAPMQMPVPMAMPHHMPMPIPMPVHAGAASAVPVAVGPNAGSPGTSPTGGATGLHTTVFYRTSKPLQRVVLEDIFSRFGQIKRLFEHSSGCSGSVTFLSAAQAQSVLSRLGKVQVNNEPIAFHVSSAPLPDEPLVTSPPSSPAMPVDHNSENLEQLPGDSCKLPEAQAAAAPALQQQAAGKTERHMSEQRAPLSPLRLSVG